MYDLIQEITLEERGRRSHKEKSTFCSPESFLSLPLIELCRGQIEVFEEEDLPILYAINQMIIQISWLIGYWSYLDDVSPEEYLDLSTTTLSFFIKKDQERVKENKQTILEEVKSLSEKTRREVFSEDELQKDIVLLHSDLEKLLLNFIMEGIEIKLLFTTLYHFWFGMAPSLEMNDMICKDDSFKKLGAIKEIIRSTIGELPEPDLPENVRELNYKMEQLKEFLPSPEELDNVDPEVIAAQGEKVCMRIGEFINSRLEQGYHLEMISNVFLSHWMRFSVFGGVSEQEWQKMDYYIKEIAEALRSYLRECYS